MHSSDTTDRARLSAASRLDYDRAMQINSTPRFHYRLGLNQPIGSPTAKRLAEMAEAIGQRDRRRVPARRVSGKPARPRSPDARRFASGRARILCRGRHPRRSRADQRPAVAALRVHRFDRGVRRTRRRARRPDSRRAGAERGACLSPLPAKRVSSSDDRAPGRSRPPPTSPGSRSAAPAATSPATSLRRSGPRQAMSRSTRCTTR